MVLGARGGDQDGMGLKSDVSNGRGNDRTRTAYEKGLVKNKTRLSRWMVVVDVLSACQSKTRSLAENGGSSW